MVVNPSVPVNVTLQQLDRNNRIVISSPLGGDVQIQAFRQIIFVDATGKRYPTSNDDQYMISKNLSAIASDTVVVGGTTYTAAQMAAIMEAFTNKYSKNPPAA